MYNRNRKYIHKPVILKVVQLNRDIQIFGKQAVKLILRSIISKLMDEGYSLFKLCFNNIRFEAVDKLTIILTVLEIQALIYFVMSLGGFTTKQCAILDLECDKILKELNYNDISTEPQES